MNDLAPLMSQSNPNNSDEITMQNIVTTRPSLSTEDDTNNKNVQINDGQQPDVQAVVQESLNNTERLPLRQHVQLAVRQYFVELEGEMPTNLYDTMLQEFERPLIEVVLEQTKGNQSKSAKILGLNRGTLRKKMSQYGLM